MHKPLRASRVLVLAAVFMASGVSVLNSNSALAVDPPIPDLSPSWCEAVPGHLVVTPGGSAASLADRGMTIEIWLRDQFDSPVPQYPREDIWLDDSGTGDIVVCPGGSLVDADTDAEGHTMISGAIAAGGWSQRGPAVYASGIPIYQTPSEGDYILYSITVNSPDINGDLEVGIADITLFVNDLQNYAFRSDFNNDGEVDLSDITTFTNHIGESCP